MSRKKKSFTDLLENSSYRWPKKGDRLLRSSEDWDRGVEFSGSEIARHVHIWNGYLSAGAALIDACEAEPHERHFLVYPILFNYRHGLELAIKWIILRYGRYADVSGDEIEHHGLWKLWQLCKRTIVKIGGSGEAVGIVEQVIKDFHDLDKTALAFRYSQDRNGALIALPDTMIDLQNLRDVMEAVGNFFDGADGQLDAYTGAVDW